MNTDDAGGRRRLTQQDIADQAGVSRATVSAVINNTRYVSPELRARILAAIDQLGYVPNIVARSMKTNRTMTIGLMPEIDPNKVTFIGNGSLMGARMSSLTNRIRQDVADVTKKMTNFELSDTPSYMDNYLSALFLPHNAM